MDRTNAEDFKNTGLASGQFRLPEEISARFFVMECLADNERGAAYLLSEKDNGGKFVLKCHLKSEGSGDNKEAELLRGLNHKGLPRFEAEFEDEKTVFVLREYAEGIALDEYIEEFGKLEPIFAAAVATELCGVLSYLHSQSPPIIHRDIKPSNIIINLREHSLKLIDFGISRRYSENADSDTEYFGTKKFSPPEQFGFSQTDSRTDIYALGVVLRFMLTGSSDGQTEDKHLARIAEKCTSLAPKDRYQSAEALKQALCRYSKRSGKKLLRTIFSAAVLCIVFAAGIMIGRYTDFLNLSTLSPGDRPYVFSEPLIGNAVRLMLNIEEDRAVTRNELDNVTELYIIGNKAVRSADELDRLSASDSARFGTISSLEDLSEMKNLRQINFFGQAVSDLSPLTECQMLVSIDMLFAPLSDLSPLESLPQLHQMNLIGTKVQDFSPLDKIPTFKLLWIGHDKEAYLNTLSRDDLDITVVN